MTNFDLTFLGFGAVFGVFGFIMGVICLKWCSDVEKELTEIKERIKKE